MAFERNNDKGRKLEYPTKIDHKILSKNDIFPFSKTGFNGLELKIGTNIVSKSIFNTFSDKFTLLCSLFLNFF